MMEIEYRYSSFSFSKYVILYIIRVIEAKVKKREDTMYRKLLLATVLATFTIGTSVNAVS